MDIKTLRLNKSWSQEQLAKLADLNVRTIQRLECGQLPSLESAKALASVFEVDHNVFRSSQPELKNTSHVKNTDFICFENVSDDTKLICTTILAVVFITVWTLAAWYGMEAGIKMSLINN